MPSIEGMAAPSGWWGDSDSSSESSEYRSSDGDASTSPDWLEHVDATGDLFYMVGLPRAVGKETTADNTSQPKDPPSPSGLLVRLIRRKSSRRSFRKGDDDTLSFPRNKAGDFYECRMRVGPPNSGVNGAGRLGLTILVDRGRLVVTVPPPDHPVISTGDVLCAIDGHAVSPRNFYSTLDDIPSGREIGVKFKSSKLKASQKASLLRASKRSLCGDDTGGWLLYKGANGAEQRYPKGTSDVPQPLIAAAGAFHTLAHLIPSLAAQPPSTSTVVLDDGSSVHVIYTLEESELLLLAFPERKATLEEAVVLSHGLVRCLRFTHGSLSRCFNGQGTNQARLDRLIHSFFRTVRDRKPVDDYDSLSCPLDSLLPPVQFLPLPKEVQVQLADAINELEANDIKQYESHRLYSIVGSVYFHKGYAIRWNLSKEELADVGWLCRVVGLLDASKAGVCDAALWTRVRPPSLGTLPARGIRPSPAAKAFVAAVAQEYDMLVVLLESCSWTARIEDTEGPNSVYMEEIQATLEHIQALGISKVISKWLDNQNGEQPQPEEEVSVEEVRPPKASPGGVRRMASTPPARHRGSVDSSSWNEGREEGGARGRSLSAGRAGTVAGGPVIGRRAERAQRADSTASLSRSSPGSDFSEDSADFKDFRSSDSGSLFDMNDLNRSLPRDLNLLPFSRNGGGVCVVQMEGAVGVILGASADNPALTAAFRKHILAIRAVLSSAAAFKTLRTEEEVAAAPLNRALIGVKEHGLLFTLPTISNSSRYWAVGRLIWTPQLREMYACYEDDCPQNLVEIAFRLALNSFM